jgi:hypothetical protein
MLQNGHQVSVPGAKSRKNDAIPPKWFYSLDTKSNTNSILTGWYYERFFSNSPNRLCGVDGEREGVLSCLSLCGALSRTQWILWRSNAARTVNNIFGGK